MAAYLRSLGARYAAMGAEPAHGRGACARSRRRTARPTSRRAGRCSTRAARSATAGTASGCARRPTGADGYVFPPLWGPDSFNDGAGMHRVLTAARFIKARMPLGDADLTDDQAFDVAAYINAQPRPEMAEPRARLPGPHDQADRQPVRAVRRPLPARAAPPRSVRADRGVLQGAEGLESEAHDPCARMKTTIDLDDELPDLPNRKDPLAGITTAAQPSAEQLAAAARIGNRKTIIDLRGVSEDRGIADETSRRRATSGDELRHPPDRGIRRRYLRQRNGARQAARRCRTAGTHPLCNGQSRRRSVGVARQARWCGQRIGIGPRCRERTHGSEADRRAKARAGA